MRLSGLKLSRVSGNYLVAGAGSVLPLARFLFGRAALGEGCGRPFGVALAGDGTIWKGDVRCGGGDWVHTGGCGGSVQAYGVVNGYISIFG